MSENPYRSSSFMACFNVSLLQVMTKAIAQHSKYPGLHLERDIPY